MLSVRMSDDASEIQTVASRTSSANRSEVVSEVITASDLSQSVQRAGSSVQSESARTAADSSAIDSSLSSVHTSPSLQHQQPTVKSQQRPSISDKGLFVLYCDLL